MSKVNDELRNLGIKTIGLGVRGAIRGAKKDEKDLKDKKDGREKRGD